MINIRLYHLSEISTNKYTKIDGHRCVQLMGQSYTLDKARTACSANEYCIGVMNEMYENFKLDKTGVFDYYDNSDNGLYKLCTNIGNTPLSKRDNFGKLDENREMSMYKKEELSKNGIL